MYWRSPFTTLCSSKDQVEFTVLDVEPLGPTRGKACADMTPCEPGQPGANVAELLLCVAGDFCSLCWPMCRWRGRATLAGTTRPSLLVLTSAAFSYLATPSLGTVNAINESPVSPITACSCDVDSLLCCVVNFKLCGGQHQLQQQRL